MSITQHVALRTTKIAYRPHRPPNDAQMKLRPYPELLGTRDRRWLEEMAQKLLCTIPTHCTSILHAIAER